MGNGSRYWTNIHLVAIFTVRVNKILLPMKQNLIDNSQQVHQRTLRKLATFNVEPVQIKLSPQHTEDLNLLCAMKPKLLGC